MSAGSGQPETKMMVMAWPKRFGNLNIALPHYVECRISLWLIENYPEMGSLVPANSGSDSVWAVNPLELSVDY